jgi:DNA polymerase/3'-5' exonuclease PolX
MMALKQAEDIANSWVTRLQPYCTRISIAGSIRRQKQEVKDIEIVCIPRTIEEKHVTLFEPVISHYRDPNFVFTVQDDKYGHILMGRPDTGKYIKISVHGHDINIDLFIAKPENWGYILAIRTGSADFSRRILAEGWVKAGYRGEEGMLHNEETGAEIPVLEEIHLFKLIRLPYIFPRDREWPMKGAQLR